MSKKQKTGKWENKSLAELKAHLKNIGMSTTGDKGTLLWRIGLHDRIAARNLLSSDGKKPNELKPAELRKSCACVGLSPIGSNDELLASLVDYLEAATPPPDASGEVVEMCADDYSTSPPGIAIAKKILTLDENDDYEGILNLLGGTYVTKSSPIAVMRKAYLKLGLLIHPDKLPQAKDQATKAFQALVRALERLSQPDVEEDPFMQEADGKKGKNKVASISRSNEGCFRTRLCCPRCNQPWSEGTLDGNPDYFYNFMMMGLICCSCSTCLCEFGAITAIHKCPFCDKAFEYVPSDYHRKVNCGNSACNRDFGFFLYNISNRAMTEMKRSIKIEQERMAKIQRTKQRRAEGRAGKKKMTKEEEEEAFKGGLVDCCPRCGLFFDKYLKDGEAQRLHLLQCGDREIHSRYEKEKEIGQRKMLAGQKRQAKQLEVQTMAQWEFLGAKSSQLYLLTDSQLKIVTEREGFDIADNLSREEMIHHIASKRKERNGRHQKRLKTGQSSGFEAAHINSNKIYIDPDDLPANMHSMSVKDLKLFCSTQGLQLQKGASKMEIIDEIEKAAE